MDDQIDQILKREFEPFDLTVYLGPDSIPWISASSRVGAIHGIPRKSASLPTVPELLDMVHDYADDIQFAELQPSDIRDLLVEASRRISRTKVVKNAKGTRKGQGIRKTKVIRALTITDAIELARRRLVEKTLKDGPSSLQTLSAITGLEGRVLSSILEPLIKKGHVVRLATGRLERFQLLR